MDLIEEKLVGQRKDGKGTFWPILKFLMRETSAEQQGSSIGWWVKVVWDGHVLTASRYTQRSAAKRAFTQQSELEKTLTDDSSARKPLFEKTYDDY